MKRIVFTISFILVVFLSINSTTFAQEGSIFGTKNDLTVSIIPSIPGPYENVALDLSTFMINVDSADISWSVDGVVVKHGIGAKSLDIKTKDVGVATVVDVSIMPVGKYLIQKKIRIVPASMDLLWEATDSFVPPFYKGKALPTEEASLKFVAIPNIKVGTNQITKQNDVVYSWSNAYSYDPTSSGFAKDTYSLKMNIVDQTEHIDVVAKSKDGAFSSSGSADTSIYDPKIIFYRASPLYGPQFTTAMNSDDYTVTNKDIGVFAEPYYMSPKDVLADTVDYTWTLNGNPVPKQTPKNVLVLHRNSNQQGDAVMELTINDTKKLLQEISAVLNLKMR